MPSSATPGPATDRSVAGAVLTGGAGRRMGTFKPLVVLGGVPLAARVIAALRDGGCDPIVAVGGDADALRVLDVPVVADRWPGEGPLGGLVTACEETFADGRATQADFVIVASCDLGRLDASTVAGMRDADPAIDFLVANGERRHPSLVRVSRRVAPAAREVFASGVRAVHRLADVLRESSPAVRVADWQVDEAALQNFNTPEDVSDDVRFR